MYDLSIYKKYKSIKIIKDSIILQYANLIELQGDLCLSYINEIRRRKRWIEMKRIFDESEKYRTISSVPLP